MRLKDLAAGDGQLERELKQLEEEARMGRDYLKGLRDEVVRLGLLAGLGLEREVLQSMADKLDYEQLLSAKEAYGRRAGERYPIRPQLSYGQREEKNQADGAFLI